jgi:hypothetical protein
MGFLSTGAIDRVIDEEAAELYALEIVLGAARNAAAKLMQRYPDHATLSQSILDAVSDGESDIRGAIAALDDSRPRHADRGGAT